MNRVDFIEGARRGFPVIVSTAPFAALFGAMAVANGQTVGEAALTSAAFFAGTLAVKAAMATALLVGLRFTAMPMLAVGWCTVMAARYLMGS